MNTRLLMTILLFGTAPLKSFAGITYAEVAQKALTYCAQIPKADTMTISCNLATGDRLGIDVTKHKPNETLEDRSIDIMVRIQSVWTDGTCTQVDYPVEVVSKDGTNYTAGMGLDPGFGMPTPCKN